MFGKLLQRRVNALANEPLAIANGNDDAGFRLLSWPRRSGVARARRRRRI